MNYPRVFLINIERKPVVGQVSMRIKIDDEAEKVFRGSYEGSDEK